MAEHPRDQDEWRVEVQLEEEGHGRSLAERLRALRLDDEARERLGGSVIVTRDGPRLYLYAWHEFSAREAERVVRDLLEEDGLAAKVQVARWHPIEDAWRPAAEPLPASRAERREEYRRHAEAAARELEHTGHFEWQVVVELPDLASMLDFARALEERDLPVRRRWKYVLVGALTEEAAVRLGRQLEEVAPEGSHVGIRGERGLPSPAFVLLGALKPGAMRDLGL